MLSIRTLAVGFVSVVTACVLSAGARASGDAPGAIYALTNSPTGNAVVAYDRAGDGQLVPAGSFATGGLGSGAGLGSQGAVIVSEDHHLVFAVNAGSDSISSFRIRPDGLELVDTAPSGGTMPTSVAFRAGLLYVLNAGVPNNVSAFSVSRIGKLASLGGLARPLSAASTDPAQVGFSDDGGTLLVTERATNVIDSYTIDEDGFLTGPFVHASSGPVPFGFAVDKRDTLIVSEAGAGGGASTYRIEGGGALDPVSSMVMTGQRAACWAVVTKNGRYGYVINAGTGNISGLAIDKDGSASLLDPSGVTATTGGNPTDAALSHDSQFLYVRVSAFNAIAAFRIRSDGSLAPLPPLTGTPAGLVGLAGF
jgi:6-phosphogluconolactonase (cycloisomerase 2 family)